jgi:hypothetical protein
MLAYARAERLARGDHATLRCPVMAKLEFDLARRYIAAVREGRWTSYGDVAEAAGNRRGAMAIAHGC